jgi:hypothetical protein
MRVLMTMTWAVFLHFNTNPIDIVESGINYSKVQNGMTLGSGRLEWLFP